MRISLSCGSRRDFCDPTTLWGLRSLGAGSAFCCALRRQLFSPCERQVRSVRSTPGRLSRAQITFQGAAIRCIRDVGAVHAGLWMECGDETAPNGTASIQRPTRSRRFWDGAKRRHRVIRFLPLHGDSPERTGRTVTFRITNEVGRATDHFPLHKTGKAWASRRRLSPERRQIEPIGSTCRGSNGVISLE